MKTIYRQLFFGVILAVAVAAGSIAATAQTATPDPCESAVTDYNEWKGLFELKDLPSRKAAVEKGKAFIAKYPNCDATNAGRDYITSSLPGMEAAIKKIEDKKGETELVNRFDTALKAKNWDEVYASGKEILAKYPDKYRAVEIALGLIGFDESSKQPPVTKWNDETVKFAKQSIADLEGGKTFSKFGVGNFTYKTKEDALGWLNYTIGFILFNDKKDKKGAAEYMYKVSQIATETKNIPGVYSSIASFYVLDLNKNIEELKALPGPVEADTPEVKEQKFQAIKAKTGMVNGAAERVLDAYARAYKLVPADAANKAFKDSLKTSIKQIYDIRYQKPDATTPTVDALIESASAKPLVNPSTPITPVIDPEKAATATTPTTVKPGTPTTVKPGTPSTVKPGATTVKPGTPGGSTPVKPAGPGTKPSPAGVKPGVATAKKKTTK